MSSGGWDDRRVVMQRLSSQLLAGPAAVGVEEVAERLLALQAQDDRGVRLAIRSRTSGLDAAAVDSALTVDRRLVVTWLNRGTLHLVRTEDYWWLHPLTAPRSMSGSERRLRQEGLDPAQAAKGIDVIVEAVSTDGPQTRAMLRARLSAAGIRSEGQALVHLVFQASAQGAVVRGPAVGREQSFVAVREWLGTPPPRLDRDEALARLARRYLAGHGPAGPPDLARWAGIPVGDARAAFNSLGADLVTVRDGLRALSTAPEPAALAPARLLGAFDPLLHGWVSRDLVVGTHAGVVTRGGVFRPVALVDGHVVGAWALPGGRVTLTLLQPLPPQAKEALAHEAADVLRFLGLPPQPLGWRLGPTDTTSAARGPTGTTS